MGQEATDSGCKLFVGGLSYDTTDTTLLAYFETFGKVVSAVVLRDPETLCSRGFGFVSFSSRREALKCLSYGNALIDNKEVEIKMAKPRPPYLSNSTNSDQADGIISDHQGNTIEVESQTSLGEDHPESDYIQTKIFVGGLLYSTGADSLKKYFTTYGEITSTEIIYNKETKISRGFGFVHFKNLDSAISVIRYQRDNERHKIDGKKVEVKRCLKKNEQSQPTNSQPNVAKTEEIEPSLTQSPKKKPLSVSIKKSSTTTKAFSFAEAAKSGTRHQQTNSLEQPPRPDQRISNSIRQGQVPLTTASSFTIWDEDSTQDYLTYPDATPNISTNQKELDFLSNFDDLDITADKKDSLDSSRRNGIWNNLDVDAESFQYDKGFPLNQTRRTPSFHEVDQKSHLNSHVQPQVQLPISQHGQQHQFNDRFDQQFTGMPQQQQEPIYSYPPNDYPQFSAMPPRQYRHPGMNPLVDNRSQNQTQFPPQPEVSQRNPMYQGNYNGNNDQPYYQQQQYDASRQGQWR